MAKDWKNHRLDAPVVRTIVPLRDTMRADGIPHQYKVEKYCYEKGAIVVTTDYLTYTDGTVDIEQNYRFEGELPGTASFGAQLYAWRTVWKYQLVWQRTDRKLFPGS